MSVTCAPRARMAVNASWPGVSRNVIVLAVRQRDVVRADVLRDAARFAGDDVRLADVVEQRRLAVVDVTHDGDDRRTRHELLGADPPRRRSPASAAWYSLSRTAWKPNSPAINSIWSKSSRWLIVTIRPELLERERRRSASRAPSGSAASSLTVMNSLTRTVLRSRSASRGALPPPASSRVPRRRSLAPRREGAPRIAAIVLEMFASTASWSTAPRLPFLRRPRSMTPLLGPPPSRHRRHHCQHHRRRDHACPGACRRGAAALRLRRGAADAMGRGGNPPLAGDGTRTRCTGVIGRGRGRSDVRRAARGAVAALDAARRSRRHGSGDLGLGALRARSISAARRALRGACDASSSARCSSARSRRDGGRFGGGLVRGRRPLPRAAAAAAACSSAAAWTSAALRRRRDRRLGGAGVGAGERPRRRRRPRCGGGARVGRAARPSSRRARASLAPSARGCGQPGRP